MSILPLDHPEPLAATLGVMLYPGKDEDSQRRARAFTARFLAEPLRMFHEAGHRLSYEELASIASDGGTALDDLDECRWGGSSTGEIFKLYWAIACTAPELASWANATKLVEAHAGRHKVTGSRSALYDARRRYLPVAHLWTAWSMRGREFRQDPDVGYSAWHDLQFFLAEAEYLRRWGSSWRSPRAGSEPPLPADTWRVPDGWAPPERQPGWPKSGGVHGLVLGPEQLHELGRPGRPKKPA